QEALAPPADGALARDAAVHDLRLAMFAVRAGPAASLNMCGVAHPPTHDILGVGRTGGMEVLRRGRTDPGRPRRQCRSTAMTGRLPAPSAGCMLNGCPPITR